MAATYEPIATTTIVAPDTLLASFNSIPSSYTDLKIVVNAKTSSGGDILRIRFNADSGTNYSTTFLAGNGTAASSASTTSASSITTSASGSNIYQTTPGMSQIDIFNYAGSTFKTVLISSANDNNGSGFVTSCVGMWRNTAAITSIILSFVSTASFDTGSTATLYGIKAA